MSSMITLGVGILTIIIGGVLLQVGTQVNGNLDNNFSCTNITNTEGQAACNTTKDNVWLILQIAPYGLVFAGLFLIFAPVMGRFMGGA